MRDSKLGASPTRVLVYSDSRVYSGAEAVLCELVAGLARAERLDLVCAAPKQNELLWESLRTAMGGVEPIGVPGQPTRLGAIHLYNPIRLRAIRRVVRHIRAEVVIVNLGSAEYGAAPLLIAPRPSQAVGFLHVPGGFSELHFRMGRLREALARRPMRRLDAVCVLTESARETVKRTWGGSGIVVHRLLPVRPRVQRVEREDARRSLSLPDATIIGLAGRITMRQKGQDTLAHAARSLLRLRSDLHFAIAGEGPDEAAFRLLLERLEIGDRFHLLGNVAPIDRFLSAIDVIAIPSRFEGLGLIALEALALGVPGVASDCDGLRDVWPARWRVTPDRPDELATKLKELLSLSREARAVAAAEGRRILDEVTSDDLAGPMERIIRELARESA